MLLNVPFHPPVWSRGCHGREVAESEQGISKGEDLICDVDDAESANSCQHMVA